MRGSNAKQCDVCCLRGRRSQSSRAAGTGERSAGRVRRDVWPTAEGSASPELPGEFCLLNLKFAWWALDGSVCSGAVEFWACSVGFRTLCELWFHLILSGLSRFWKILWVVIELSLLSGPRKVLWILVPFNQSLFSWLPEGSVRLGSIFFKVCSMDPRRICMSWFRLIPSLFYELWKVLWVLIPFNPALGFS